MEHWGIYVAYAWLATINWAFMDALQAIRNGPQPELQPLPADSHNHNRRMEAGGVGPSPSGRR